VTIRQGKFHTGRSGHNVQTKIENAPFGKSLPSTPHIVARNS
jgi:hypothetical protein